MAAVANALSLTPSGISQQIASLERQAGVKLTEPNGRRVRVARTGCRNHILRATIGRASGVHCE
jgi:DNA-binding transcriptional LysR family regulator